MDRHGNKDTQASANVDQPPYEDPKELEDKKVAGAVRTDLTLSAEIMAMLLLLAGLAIIGTAAMLWVGGGIILHGMEVFGLSWLPHLFHGIADTVVSV